MNEQHAESPQSAHTPVNLKLVGLVIAVVAVAIIGYGLLNNSDELPEGVLDPVITGQPLPEYANDPLNDSALGQAMPTVVATDFQGTSVGLEATGKPQIVLFLAHWCSHCRDEVPVIRAWMDAGNLPDAVEFRSVATAIDSGRDNYPPDRWLERERWTPEVIVDTNSDVARAYGLSAFPYWVLVDADGAVVARRTGSLSVEQLNIFVENLQR